MMKNNSGTEELKQDDPVTAQDDSQQRIMNQQINRRKMRSK